MLGAEDTLGSGEMSVLLCDSRGDPICEQHYLKNLLARAVDGIMLTARRLEPRPAIGTDLAVRVVYACAQSQREEDISIFTGDGEGAPRRRTPPDDRPRQGRPYHGPRPDRSHLGSVPKQPPVYSKKTGSRWSATGLCGASGPRPGAGGAVALLLRGGQPFNAIFCGSEQIARGVLKALREAGIQVPADVGVVGFDNWEVMSLASRPLLSTVDLARPLRRQQATRRHRRPPRTRDPYAALQARHPPINRHLQSLYNPT